MLKGKTQKGDEKKLDQRREWFFFWKTRFPSPAIQSTQSKLQAVYGSRSTLHPSCFVEYRHPQACMRLTDL